MTRYLLLHVFRTSIRIFHWLFFHLTHAGADLSAVAAVAWAGTDKAGEATSPAVKRAELSIRRVTLGMVILSTGCQGRSNGATASLTTTLKEP
ncbi:hypothetical protein ACWGH8_21605 [Nonomuraea muscovyensis]|uniref:Secreted protein n=1 Tax=Nonomuraea muscovyensis TaxID=1124761 RepID=A0A7X0C2B5_9ACTN|nr:hypothetical protein [Nonomuraea muscovyensis]MBB6347158.1 hypothetical protein [Nonomuraea muscovyensis]